VELRGVCRRHRLNSNYNGTETISVSKRMPVAQFHDFLLCLTQRTGRGKEKKFPSISELFMVFISPVTLEGGKWRNYCCVFPDFSQTHY
jgi:hypothetical protein